jgi:methylthioribose-1-phosphate isomerase
MTEHIIFSDEQDALLLLDQRYLPAREETFVCRNLNAVIYALQTMVVRGAPAIGVTAAYGCYLAAREIDPRDADWRETLEAKLVELENARPTAVNLRWAVSVMRELWLAHPAAGLAELAGVWLAKAKEIHAQDVATNRRMGFFGAELLEGGDRVMTHCNAGALATAGFGTALGVIYAAVEQGKAIRVIANETRPFLQGARLTAYELQRAGVPCDNACGLLMARGLVDKVIVGADRIAANGDTANKIGTYSVALLAMAHNIPFYVAAPASTFDLSIASGLDIPIEVRPSREVTHVGETRLTPLDVEVYNFAFDVTPADLITAIVTDKGVLRPPYAESIRAAIG